ncbi:MAG: DNA mismatch repair endonuclease MutL [Acidobacteriota bacterium]|nr:DNA mismatch repair endonuclease MutL [Acidobacteriota bacterium]MDQ7086759.1 DNA mismatch repair endonuclease MutL [Acidobacteriota bacterium]
MGRIKVLEQAIADRIAAGEVVERPASVLRELLDNALDAGAGKIEIVLAAGGRELIQASDDGCGMGRDDALLAFERHATSKIRSGEDLERIATLGFRGEALAATAAVARVELLTADDDSGQATRVVIEQGRLSRVDPASRARGTTIRVMDLFAGIPARRKFLKTPATELDHCLKVARRAAMARPEVGFRLRQAQRTLMALPPGQPVGERIAGIVGAAVARRLVEIQRQAGDLAIEAWAGPVDLARSSRDGIHLFLNRRPVRDPFLVRAVLDVYRPLLPSGRFPVVVVWLEVPPGEVDVNVHPAKSEVRFHQPRQVRALVVGALQQALASRAAIPHFGRERLDDGAAAGGGGVAFGGERSAPERPPFLPVEGGEVGASPPPSPRAPASSPGAEAQGALVHDGPRVLAQYRNTFIVAEDARGLLIVDQHVAHERLLYEQLCRQAVEGPLPRQGLMFPRPLEVGPRELEVATGQHDALARLGFRFESFGESSLIVREVPAVFGNEARPEALVEVLARFERGDRAGAEDFFDHLLATVACQAAVKKGYPLGPEKMAYLLGGLEACECPSHCPHGRVISLRIDLSSLNSRFERS